MIMICWLKNMNLANKISFLRIGLIPIVLLVMLLDFKYSNFVAAILFILAASTDSMDGYIARKRNEITNLGKFLDPLADKLLVMSTLIVLVDIGRLHSAIAIIIISREVIITGFRALAASFGNVIAAGIWGKIKTILQIVAISALILDNFPFSLIRFPFDTIILYAAVIATLYSGYDYIKDNIGVLLEKSAK